MILNHKLSFLRMDNITKSSNSILLPPNNFFVGFYSIFFPMLLLKNSTFLILTKQKWNFLFPSQIKYLSVPSTVRNREEEEEKNVTDNSYSDDSSSVDYYMAMYRISKAHHR